jgi:hypothetical protein
VIWGTAIPIDLEFWCPIAALAGGVITVTEPEYRQWGLAIMFSPLFAALAYLGKYHASGIILIWIAAGMIGGMVIGLIMSFFRK